MDILVVFFGLFFLISIGLSPFLAAEGRPAFLRPERKPRQMVSSMRQSDWDKPRGWEL